MTSPDSMRSSLSGAPRIDFDPDWSVKSVLYSDVDSEAGIWKGFEDRNSVASSTASKDVEKQESPGDNKKSDEEEEKDPNLVEWEGGEAENPFNWSKRRRWCYTVLLGSLTFVVTFASSVFSTATTDVSETWGVSTEVSTLGTSLFILGFAFGPLAWGPFSEIFGRKRALYPGYFIFAIFNIPVAVSSELYTIMICRFFGGFFASAPLGVIAGYIADMFEATDRGVAIALFSAATFIGPISSPIVGGFIEMTIGWQWSMWLTLILACVFGTLALFIVPETYAPTLLQQKAKRLRFETRNWALHAPLDEVNIDMNTIATKYLLRPVIMLCLEPILILITIYVSFIYGLIYLLFEAFPISYQEERGYNEGVGALPFLGIMIGVLCGVTTITVHSKTRYARLLKENGSVAAEERLVPMFLGAISLPIGLFWFAWTSYKRLNPWPQIISGIPIGMGVQVIFLQGFNYIIDTYLMNANSAISANTFIRSWVGAGFPLIALPMYAQLGVQWGSSLLGFIAVGMMPIPVFFWFYGAKIRSWSKFSPTL